MSLNRRYDPKTAKKLTRRGLILFGAQAGFVGLLGMRLRYLQVDQADQFRLLAEENRINIRLLAPMRGLITDRNGVDLAENIPNYRIIIVREQAGDAAEILARLATIIPLEQKDIDATLKLMKRRAAFVPVTVAERLSWPEMAAVAANAPALPGISAEVGSTRFYPRGKDFAHIVGYVGPVSEYDLSHTEDQDPLLQIPKFQIGKTGVEKKIDRRLRGFSGSKRIEVNAVGRVMRELDRNDSKTGAGLELTVDSHLQNYLQARLGDYSASAALIDVNTGEIMAIGSTPSFDPNKFVTGISSVDYKMLTSNKFRPLANKSVQGTYPPGSTFKMMVALAALEAGVIDLEETIYCPGYYDLGNQRFNDWKRSGHGNVNLRSSLRDSCDVFYYIVSQRVGIEKIAAMARRFGLGSRLDLPLNGIAAGLIPTKEWKRSNVGEPWRIGDTLNSAIGQGFVLTSPMQLATMAARLATGRAVVPKLIRSVDGVKTAFVQPLDLGLSDMALNAVRGGMFAVSNERGATAYSTRIAEKTMRMAGKTGTSQVWSISKKQRARGVARNADLPWERRDHALFVAFAPFDRPRFAMAVVVEHGGGGSRFAAPIARDVMLEALYGGQPPATAYPRSQRTRIKNERKLLDLRPEVNKGDQA
ncbi:MAG: penicillin-binding protein 2 [Alphaproteobacteria bacterium]|nr:penicillin-binding protein 2 [Alphaproteobacteria bacterium]